MIPDCQHISQHTSLDLGRGRMSRGTDSVCMGVGNRDKREGPWKGFRKAGHRQGQVGLKPMCVHETPMAIISSRTELVFNLVMITNCGYSPTHD